MASIGQHISDLRNIFDKHGRVQGNFTDQQLYSLLLKARSKIIRDQLTHKNNDPQWNHKQICMPLETVAAIDCDCVPAYLKTCKVARSIYEIPKMLGSRTSDSLVVTTLDGKKINVFEEYLWKNIYKHDAIRSRQLAYSIVNRHLYIWNRPDLKAVHIKGIWEDPTETIPVHNSDGTVTTDLCQDIFAIDMGLDGEFALQAYKMVIEMMSLNIQANVQNNSNEEKFNTD